MITLLTGENDFEMMRALQDTKGSFQGVSEHYEGADIDLKQLPDMVAGATLFADKRLVIIDTLSANKVVWNALPEWLERLSDDVHLVLVDQKPDKRTKTYKEVQKRASVRVFTAWTDRDVQTAERWVQEEAARQGMTIDGAVARLLVARIGPMQWGLFHALQKLAVFDTVTTDLVERIIDANASENVFNLFDAALSGDKVKVGEMIKTLRQTEDPYMVMGLLSSQMIQLSALVTAGPQVSSGEVAKAIGAHPFALHKLSGRAKHVSKAQLKMWVSRFADADTQLKSSVVEPWVIVEQMLVGL